MSEQYKTDALIWRLAKDAGVRAEIRHKDWPADGITEVHLFDGRKTRQTMTTVYADQTEEQIGATVRAAIARLRPGEEGGG